jgi:hypothetical protein
MDEGWDRTLAMRLTRRGEKRIDLKRIDLKRNVVRARRTATLNG